jgi:hypothetical protein
MGLEGFLGKVPHQTSHVVEQGTESLEEGVSGRHEDCCHRRTVLGDRHVVLYLLEVKRRRCYSLGTNKTLKTWALRVGSERDVARMRLSGTRSLSYKGQSTMMIACRSCTVLTLRHSTVQSLSLRKDQGCRETTGHSSGAEADASDKLETTVQLHEAGYRIDSIEG